MCRLIFFNQIWEVFSHLNILSLCSCMQPLPPSLSSPPLSSSTFSNSEPPFYAFVDMLNGISQVSEALFIFLIFFFFSFQSAYFHLTCPQFYRFFLLSVQTCCWSPLISFLIQLLCFQFQSFLKKFLSLWKWSVWLNFIFVCLVF